MFGLEKASIKRTLAPRHAKLSKDSRGTPVAEQLYISIIGGLLCLMTSKPNIAFAVDVCAWQVVQKIVIWWVPKE